MSDEKKDEKNEYTSDRDHVMIASPADWGGHRAEGWAYDECSVCKCKVTLAPTSQIFQIENPGRVRVVCLPCAAIEMEGLEKPPELGTIPGQAEEIANELNRLDPDEE